MTTTLHPHSPQRADGSRPIFKAKSSRALGTIWNVLHTNSLRCLGANQDWPLLPNQEDQELTQRLFLLVSLKKRGRSIEYVCTSGRTCRLGTYQYPRFQWPMAEAGALCCNIKVVKKVSAYK